MRVLLTLAVLLASLTALAVEEIVQLTVDGESTSEIPSNARSDALKQAIDKGALTVITNIISAPKVEKNIDVIKSKVLPESSKYIQFYKATEPVKAADKTTVTVTMKISTAALREILDGQGLLVQTDDVFNVLPLVRIVEKKAQGRSYAWWKDDYYQAAPAIKDQIKNLAGIWTNQQPKGYRVVDPIGQKLFQVVPERYKVDNPTVEDALQLAQELKAEIVVIGEAAVYPGDKPNKAKTILHLTTYYAGNSRQLAESMKTYESTVAKANQDLAMQAALRPGFTDAGKATFASLQSEFKKGTFGSQTVNIVVRGDLNYLDLENLKKEILLKIPEMRTLRERSMEKGRMALEGDLVGSVNQLVKKIETSKFEKFELRVDNVATGGVELKWYRLGG